jgi:hypothetical protein
MEFVFRQGQQTFAFTAWNYHDLTLTFFPHISSQIFLQHSSFCRQPASRLPHTHSFSSVATSADNRNDVHRCAKAGCLDSAAAVVR